MTATTGGTPVHSIGNELALELLRAENRILELVARNSSLSQVLTELALSAEQLLGNGVLCSILLLDHTNQHLLHGAAPSLPTAYNDCIHGVGIGPGVGSCGTAAATAEEVIVRDISTHPYWKDFKDLAAAHDLRACWSTPILSSTGRVLGTFAMYSRVPSEPDLAAREVVRLLSRTAALVIERDRAEHERQQSAQRVEAMYRTGLQLAAERDLKAIVQSATDAAREVSGAAFGAFFYNQVNEAGESYMLYTLSGVAPDSFAKFPMPRNTAVFSPTFRGEGALRSHDITADPRYGKSAPHHGMPQGHLPVRSYLAVPVKSQSGEVLGGLFFGHPEPGVFTAESERLVVSIASQAAVAMDNARLQQNLRTQLRRYQEMEATLCQAQQTARLATWRWDMNSGTVSFTPGSAEIFGGALASLQTHEDWFESVHPLDRDAVLATCTAAVARGEDYQVEYRVPTPHGDRWIFTRGHPVWNQAEDRPVAVIGISMDVTERKRVELALIESESRFRQAHEAAQLGAYVWDLATDRVEWSAELPSLKNIQTDDRVAGWLEYVHPQDRAEAVERIQALRQGIVEDTGNESRLVRADGTVVWLYSKSRLLRGPDGTPSHVVGVTMDISERKRNELALRRLVDAGNIRGPEIFSAIAHAISELLGVRWVLVAELVEGHRARTLASIAGDVLGANWEYDLQHTPCHNVITSLEVCYYPSGVAELFPQDKSLTEMGAQAYVGAPLRGSDGRALGLIVALHDGPIEGWKDSVQLLQSFSGLAAVELERQRSDRQREELIKALAVEREQLHRIFEKAPAFITVVRGPDHIFEVANPAYLQLVGRDVLNRKMREALPEVEGQGYFELLDQVYRTGQPFVGKEMPVFLRRSAEGPIEQIFVDFVFMPLRDSADSVNGILIHGVNVTEQVTARHQVEELVRINKTITDNAASALFMMNPDGHPTFMNPAAERITGYTLDEIKHRPLHYAVHYKRPDGSPYPMSECPIDRASETIKPVRELEEIFVRKDGTLFPVACSVAPIEHNGERLGAVVEFRDVSEQRRAEEALRQSEKLAATGRLAATIAHEINNPLEAVTNFIYLARRNKDLPEAVQRQLEVADKELSRVTHIAQQTLGFYRDTTVPVVVDLAEVVHDVLALYERKLQYKGLTADVQTMEGTLVLGLQGELRQMLSNLLANAIDASGESGVIRVRVVRARHPRNGVRGVRLVVADRGCGMTPQLQAKLFTPFVTTKKDVGTGLGLWVTRAMVEKHGGVIRFRSRHTAPSGTVFSIFLPAESRREQQVA